MRGLGDKIRGLWNEYLFERFTDAALDDLGDEADRLESDLENTRTTLEEDLRYQEKLENRLERIRVVTATPATDVGNYARGYNNAVRQITAILED